ncbi:uncharacterized protein LOC135488178 [Lineus longissimus]|uniref:uncharacterized protein LOC135488178 n=1 Tax=Lineus longissimus TaxID=88925 RepID=UPI002B4C73AA
MSKEKRKSRSSNRNLVVNACTKVISNHPGHLTNSQRTISTNGLSNSYTEYSESYSPEKYGTRGNTIGSSLKKSVSFSDEEVEKVKGPKFNSTAEDALDAEVANSFLNTDETQLQEELQKIMNGSTLGYDFDDKLKTGKSDLQWFVNPVHKNRLDFPMHQTASTPERSASPLNRSSGNLGAAIAAKHIARERLKTPPTSNTSNLMDEVQMRRLDRCAEEFFPVTLGASFSVRASLASPPPKSKTVSPPAKGLPSPGEPWRPISPRKKRPKSPTREDVDRMYLMSSVAPTIGSSTVLLTTPYQHDLARLRMERLRIEEQQMLEVKRIQELERIRGPVPKWYELKTPDFHYEAHKNTELMKSSDCWQDLMDYRKDLMKASQEYKKTYLTQ